MRSNPLPTALARCRRAVLAVALFSLTINLLMLTVSVYMMQVFDRVLASGSVATLVWLSVVAVGAIGLLGLLDATRMRVLADTGLWLEQRLGPDVLTRIVDAAQAQAGCRTEPLRELASLRGFLAGTTALALFDAPWLPIYLVFAYLLHPLIGHVALSGALALLALALVNDRVTRGALGRANAAAARSMQRAEACVRHAGPIDALGMLPGITRHWAADAADALALHAAAANLSAVVLALSRFCRLLVQIAVVGVGAWLVVRDELTGGAMIAGSIILGRALAPVEQAIGTWKAAAHALHCCRRLNAFLDARLFRPESMPLPAPRGHLTVENVSYGPPGGPFTLRNVSFAVRPGEALAIIGPSAAGKSTLARLLVGGLAPTAGTVRLDGADVFAWPRPDFGRHVGYLPQEVELLAGTVRENIARMDQGADATAIVEAASLAGVHQLILRLPDGYETQIGEDGIALSGGQRQRIALARTLFGRPRLIVLDEPNASLDGEGEQALARAIAAMKAAGAAVVVVGHRVSTVARVDRVLVLRAGMVEAVGPREAVLDRITAAKVASMSSRRPSPDAAAPQAAEA